jgi:hypothetical protein
MKYLAFDDKKRDGIGAQMIRRFFLWGYCKITDDVEYVHVPFVKSSHHKDDYEYGKKVEEFFNLGYNELYIDDIEYNKITFMGMCRKGENCVPRLFKKHPYHFNMVKELYLEKFNKSVVHSSLDSLNYDYYNIVVHIRRGDLFRFNNRFKQRANSDEFFLDAIQFVRNNTLCNYQNKPLKIIIITEDSRKIFDGKRNDDIANSLIKHIDSLYRFRNLKDVELRINEDAIQDLYYMFRADVLIKSSSCFSTIASHFSNGVVVSSGGKGLTKIDDYRYTIEDKNPPQNLEYYMHSDFIQKK